VHPARRRSRTRRPYRLPNGLGLIVHDADEARAVGVAPNKLTAAEDRDQWAGTPWHKHVPAKIEVL
jgi:hypothetical protein